MEIISPSNNVIVKIDSKFVENVTNAIKMANLNPGSQLNPADYVNITGEVVSLPKSISKRMDYRGYTTKDVQVGDIAIFSYKVIFSFDELPDGNAGYRNLFWYKGQEYWLVDIQELYGVIRGNDIIMVNGYCMVGDLSPKSEIVLLNKEKKRKPMVANATLWHIGNNLETAPKIKAEAGDKVYYNPNRCLEYKLGEKKFGIVRQKDIGVISIGQYSILT